MVVKKDLLARLTMILLLGCSLFFAFDVVIDVLSGQSQDSIGMLHLVVETVATIAILVSLMILRDYIRVNKKHEVQMQESLDQLKRGLNDLIMSRVKAFALTPTETEVAILTIKGFSISEIAELRGRSEGTVKAQQHAVYQKAAVSSRAELILECIEDAVDLSTEVKPL
jgi:DNA-binding NarL/FixJ family response regulator